MAGHRSTGLVLAVASMAPMSGTGASFQATGSEYRVSNRSAATVRTRTW